MFGRNIPALLEMRDRAPVALRLARDDGCVMQESVYVPQYAQLIFSYHLRYGSFARSVTRMY